MVAVGMRVIPERCTGCRVCQLICAITYRGRFCPEDAHVVVGEDGPRHTDECLACGLCADHCPAGALEREEREIADCRLQIAD